MFRLNKLLVGASWMGEYGNPDIPEEWAYIKSYSPYHNRHKDVHYSKVFFTTSTRDDQVHSGHARKMVAKMKDVDVLYYKILKNGMLATNNHQAAELNSMVLAY